MLRVGHCAYNTLIQVHLQCDRFFLHGLVALRRRNLLEPVGPVRLQHSGKAQYAVGSGRHRAQTHFIVSAPCHGLQVEHRALHRVPVLVHNWNGKRETADFDPFDLRLITAVDHQDRPAALETDGPVSLRQHARAAGLKGQLSRIRKIRLVTIEVKEALCLSFTNIHKRIQISRSKSGRLHGAQPEVVAELATGIARAPDGLKDDLPVFLA